MRRTDRLTAVFALPMSASLLIACSSATDPGGPALPAVDDSCAGACPQSNVKHVIVIVQENHTFDTHFGRYCTAPAGSNPTCTDGPACCEAAPAADPTGNAPVTIDDYEMGSRDPDHTQACESAEMNGGAMDHYTTETCSSPRNVAVADPTIIKPYWDYAAAGALADRYFQPIIGQSSSNDMYLARAQYVFTDNEASPKTAIGVQCGLESTAADYPDLTIGDFLTKAAVPWTWFGEGYKTMVDAQATGACPPPPDDCGLGVGIYPCVFDPSDVPFAYYASTRDKPDVMKDFTALESALDGGGLPAVSYVKAIGYKTEHPGAKDKLSDGVAFVTSLVDRVTKSRYRESTLVLLTYDEGGGYFDHVKPPPTSTIDHQPYGTRVPLVAMGPFAKENFVSHVTMEHSSIVKFVEWNWLGGQTGQLAGRDTQVANIGSLLDPGKTGVAVPEN